MILRFLSIEQEMQALRDELNGQKIKIAILDVRARTQFHEQTI